MDISKQVKSIRKREEALTAQIKELIMNIVNSLDNANLPDVKKVPNTSVCCCTVSLSTVAQYGKLSPEFYITEYQKEAIAQKLNNINSLKQLSHFVNEAVENGFIMRGTEKIHLNPAMIENIKELNI